MARITLRQLLDHAAENNYGVPAFNINNMEQALAIMEAAAKTDAPVIIQAIRISPSACISITATSPPPA
jgi:fructose-bisphosphate aldolase, class II